MNKYNYLTYSKAKKIMTHNVFGFIKDYVLKEKPEQKESWKMGTDIHNLLYSLILGQHFDEQFVVEPEKWKTKKECGFTIEEQKQAFQKEAKEKNLSPVKHSFLIYKEQLERKFKTSKLLQKLKENKDKIKFETEIVNDKYSMSGIIDIMTPNTIIDVKTTGREVECDSFFKWQEKIFAIQEVLYKFLVKKEFGEEKLRDFYFICIQTVHPYEITFNKLNPEISGKADEWFFRVIYPRYLDLIEKINAT